MGIKTRIIIVPVGSFLLFSIGIFRLITESNSSTPLFVAYVFAITGFIGLVANSLKLIKIMSN